MSNVPMSFKVNATISAQRVVTMLTGTANTVKVPAANTEFPIGITLDTVLDTTGAIPVAGVGMMAKLYFNDTCGSGSAVSFDSAGRGILHVAVSTGSYSVGILVGPKADITGTVANVLIMPMYDAAE